MDMITKLCFVIRNVMIAPHAVEKYIYDHSTRRKSSSVCLIKSVRLKINIKEKCKAAMSEFPNTYLKSRQPCSRIRKSDWLSFSRLLDQINGTNVSMILCSF